MEQNQNAVVIAVVEYENVYATKFLRIGDEVVMNMDKEARGWGRKGVPDGTKGIVRGFFEYYDARHLNRTQNPGIYRGNGAAVVQWETGEADTHGSDLAMPKWLIEARRLETKHNKAFEEMVKMYELPEFAFMVGNKVETKREYRQQRGMGMKVETENATITDIDFADIIERRTGQLLPLEKWKDDRIIHVDLEGGGSTRVSISEIIRIVEQGNYWAWTHDSTQLKFKDLQEEVVFYASMGKRQQLRSPRTGDYKWTLEDALEAIEKGDADGLGKSLALFGATPFPTVYKFDDDLKDLSERCRAETLKGFAEYERKELPPKKYMVTFTLPGTHRTITATREFDQYIKPLPDDPVLMEGNQYNIVHTFSLDSKDDDPVVFTPVALAADSVWMRRANGVEDSVEIPLAVHIEAAYRFFDNLSQNGWLVDNSKFIVQ